MIKIGNLDISMKVGSDDVSAAYLGNTLVYSGGTPTHDYSQDYLTFVAKESGTFQFTKAINYSIDGGTNWTSLAANSATPTIASGNKILWKATLTSSAFSGIGTFSSTGQFDAEGNAMSLLYGDNFIGETDLTGKNYALMYLFNGCTSIVSAANLVLPATTLAQSCCEGMFEGCTSLTTAPSVLPATTLAEFCYFYMFRNCTSLTTAPQLPATTLTENCYSQMFYGCTSLTTAPELPATTLASNCYYGMFYVCTNLNYIKCLATDISASSCTFNWVNGVSSSGTFVKDANMAGWTVGDNGIPNYNWTVVDNV